MHIALNLLNLCSVGVGIGAGKQWKLIRGPETTKKSHLTASNPQSYPCGQLLSCFPLPISLPGSSVSTVTHFHPVVVIFFLKLDHTIALILFSLWSLKVLEPSSGSNFTTCRSEFLTLACS